MPRSQNDKLSLLMDRAEATYEKSQGRKDALTSLMDRAEAGFLGLGQAPTTQSDVAADSMQTAYERAGVPSEAAQPSKPRPVGFGGGETRRHSVMPDSLTRAQRLGIEKVMEERETAPVAGRMGIGASLRTGLPTQQRPWYEEEKRVEETDKLGILEKAKRINWYAKAPFSPAGLFEKTRRRAAQSRLEKGDYPERSVEERYREMMDQSTFGGGVYEEAPPGVGPFIPGVGRSPRIHGEQLRQADEALIETYKTRMQEEAERGWTFPAKVFEGASNLPAWMVEFGMTAGLAGIGSAKAIGAAKAIFGSSFVKTKAGRLALKAAGWIGGATARTLAMPHRVGEATLEGREEITFGPEGEVEFDITSKNWASSIARGWTHTFVETASETAGGAIGRVGKRIAGGLPFGKQLVGGMQRAWLKLNPSKTAADFANKLFTKGGYDGMVGELGEETLATIMHAIVGTEDFGAGKDANVAQRLVAGLQSDWENLPVTATVLAIPGAGRIALSRTIALREKGVQPTPAEISEEITSLTDHLSTIQTDEELVAVRDRIGALQPYVTSEESVQGLIDGYNAALARVDENLRQEAGQEKRQQRTDAFAEQARIRSEETIKEAYEQRRPERRALSEGQREGRVAKPIIGEETAWTNPEAPELLDFLSQYMPTSQVVSLSGEERLSFANNPDLLQAASARGLAGKVTYPTSTRQTEPYSAEKKLTAEPTESAPSPQQAPISEPVGEKPVKAVEAEKRKPWDMTRGELGDLYHGGKKPIEEIDFDKVGQRDYGFFGEGFYTATNEEFAKAYGPKISKIRLGSNARILKAALKPQDAPKGLVDEVVQWYDKSYRKRAIDRGREKSFPIELEAIKKEHLAWVDAVNSFAKGSNYNVVKFTDGEVVILDQRALSAQKTAQPVSTEIPDFVGTADAEEFGVTATPDQIAELERLRKESLSRGKELEEQFKKTKDVGLLDESSAHNARGQFIEEAASVAEKQKLAKSLGGIIEGYEVENQVRVAVLRDRDGNRHTIPDTELWPDQIRAALTGAQAGTDVPVKSSFEQIFRGEGATSEKGGAYWSPNKLWAAQFTQTGQVSGVISAQIKTSNIYDEGAGKRPYAGDPDAIDKAVKGLREKGFKAIRLDEGEREPPSVFVFDQSAIKSEKKVSKKPTPTTSATLLDLKALRTLYPQMKFAREKGTNALTVTSGVSDTEAGEWTDFDKTARAEKMNWRTRLGSLNTFLQEKGYETGKALTKSTSTTRPTPLSEAIRDRGVRGDDLVDAVDRINEAKSCDKAIEIDKSGYVTLYHRTTEAAANSIKKSGLMMGKEVGLFFGSKPEGQISGYGDAVVKVRVPIEKLELNDIFTDEVHFRLVKTLPGKKYKIEILKDTPPTFERTAAGDQATFAGIAPRQVPKDKIQGKGEDVGVKGTPLFTPKSDVEQAGLGLDVKAEHPGENTAAKAVRIQKELDDLDGLTDGQKAMFSNWEEQRAERQAELDRLVKGEAVGKAVEAEGAVKEQPASVAPQINDTFTYEGKEYQITELPDDSDGKVRAQDLSASVPIGRVWSTDAKVKLERETGLKFWPDVAKTVKPVVSKKEPSKAPSLSQTPSAQVASWVERHVIDKTPFKISELVKEADRAFGGTLGKNTYDIKQATDAMELGINKFIQKQPVTLQESQEDAQEVVRALRKLVEVLPTQGRQRTERMVEFQQFSTPPHLAYVASWMANIQSDDVVLEPSAGVGGIAIYPKMVGAATIVNELAPERRVLLEELGFDEVFGENAEQIDNVLPERIKPTVVIMNPPFSATGGRVSIHNTFYGARHVEQALERLEPNGRLVAIVGRGMAEGTPNFKKWWNNIKRKYNVKANVQVSGKEYVKYGTTFDNQLLIIDKDGPTIGNPVIGQFENLEDVIPALEVIRNARPVAERERSADRESVSDQSERSKPAIGGKRSVAGQPSGLPHVTKTRTGQRSVGGDVSEPTLPERGGERVAGTGTGKSEVGGGVIGDEKRETVGGQPEKSSGKSRRGRAKQSSESRLKVEKKKDQTSQPISSSIYESYQPKVTIGDAKPHPAKLVESAAMASSGVAETSYIPNLPEKTVKEGKVSDVQLEAVIHAGTTHEKILSDGSRKGFFIGDGTGVGKGREIAAVIWDNYRKGRKKAVWISQNWKLYTDAQRDLRGIGWSEGAEGLISLQKAGKKAIPESAELVFLTYDSLRGAGKTSFKEIEQAFRQKGEFPDNFERAVENMQVRINQLYDWLGADFDGVIAFDESHNMANAVAMKGMRGTKKPAAKALAGIFLQDMFPKARVLYVSATGATDVINLSYVERLGLWGEGTAFANREQFVNDITQGGLQAMELVAQNMKLMGVYTARSLSYDGVKYDRLEHKLTTEQREIYDEMAGAWQIVLQNLPEALEATGAKKGAALSAFWGAQQRFFNQVITAMQMPSVVGRIKKDVVKGDAVLVQLTNTGEAQEQRALKSRDPEAELEELDMTPRENLLQFLEKSFPVQQFEEYTDEHGNTRSRMVVDANGKPILNRGAVAVRDELLAKVGSIRVPDSPLNFLINQLGQAGIEVGEVTGRKERVVYSKKEGKRVLEKRSGRAADHDIDRFMNDEVQVLVFSEKGGVGASYHADLDTKNQRHRVHYLVQPGWRADRAIQGLGRSHRSNQANIPEYVLATTDLKGQARFLSTIARRLDQLGALTKGQRQTGSQGIFQARDNLENDYAKIALKEFLGDVAEFKIDGIDPNDFQDQTGLKILGEGANIDGLEMRQFLNRLLSLKYEMQNKVFDEFSKRMDVIVDAAAEAGTLDVGIETITGEKVVKVSDEVVHTDEATSAETRHISVEVTNPADNIEWNEAQERYETFYHNIKSNRIWGAGEFYSVTSETGAVQTVCRLQGPNRFHAQQRLPADTLGDSDKWVKIGNEEAIKLWQAELDKLPTEVTDTHHMITGALLPIWDRLRGKARIYRMQTDAGERVLGRLIPPKDLHDTLQNLGVGTEQIELSGEDALRRIIDENAQVALVNGWKIRRAQVSGENRVEIIGPGYYERDLLRQWGIFEEQIEWRTRYFVPTTKQGEGALDRIFGNHEIVAIEKAYRGKKLADAHKEEVVKAGPKMEVPVSDGEIAPEPISTEHVVRTMSELFNVPVRVGRFRQKAAGIYKKRAKVVRTKKYADIGATAHDIAHHVYEEAGLDAKIPANLRAEVRSLDYDQDKLRLDEGFAEFVRYYLTTDEAQSKAPKFHKWFEMWAKDNGYSSKLNEAEGLITTWRTQGSVARVLAQISSTDKKSKNKQAGALYVQQGPLAQAWKGFLSQWTNRQQPLWDVAKTMARTVNLSELPIGEDFASAAKVMTMTGGVRARQAILDYMPDVAGNKVGQSAKEIFAPIADDLNGPGGTLAFEGLCYARHALDVLNQGKNPGITKQDAEATIEHFGSRPGWMKASDGITEWHNQLLDYLVDAGGLSEENRAKMRKMYPHYVPLQREIRNMIAGGAGGHKLANLPSPVRRLVGSGRMVVSPLESSLQYAERIFALADKIRIGNMLVDAAEKYGGMGKWIEEVSPKMIPHSAVLSTIKGQLEKAGVDLEQTELDAVITIFENAYKADSKDNVIILWRDGKRKLYQVSPDLYRSVTGLDQHFQLPKVISWVFGKPARAVRLGAVGIKVSFGWIANPFRDVQTAPHQTERKGWKGTLPSIVIDSVGGVIADITNNNIARLYKAGGGEMAQPLGIDRKFVRDAIKLAIANTPSKKAAYWANHPIESMRSVVSIPELGPRIAEFKSALEETGWKEGDKVSFGQYVGAQLRAANVTVDFREGGNLSMWINQTNPFFNVGIQGPNRMVYAIRKHPVSWMFKALTHITIPAIAMWAAYKDEDWYKGLPTWEKFSYWHIKVGGTVIKIPTPFDWFSVFGAIPLAALDSVNNNDPKYIKEALEELLDWKKTLPAFLPTAFKVPVEVATNYDFFRSRHLFSEEKNLEPEDQFYGYNTELAKKVGKVFGIVPAKFEHLLAGYTGGMAPTAIKNTEVILRKLGVLPIKGVAPPEMADLPIIGRLFLRPSTNRVFDDFYVQLKKLREERGSHNLHGTKMSGNRDLWRLKMGRAARELSEHRKETRKIIEDTGMSTEKKRTRIMEIREMMLRKARAALSKTSGTSPSKLIPRKNSPSRPTRPTRPRPTRPSRPTR